MDELAFFNGRQLLLAEVSEPNKAKLADDKIKQVQAMAVGINKVSCLRCGSSYEKKTVEIGNRSSPLYYCPGCILLGRVDSEQVFYQYQGPTHKPNKRLTLGWDGVLSSSQKKGSQKIKQAIKSKKRLLVHGVTGAGKTEMVFAGILHALQQGQRVGFASPRVDVCLEIAPRLAAAFPENELMLLYGGQKETYQARQLVVCTTHQLLRFKAAFDVLIVDEIDAFPYADSPLLQFGVAEAVKSPGSLILLTATPSANLLKEVKQGTLELIVIPGRYHRHPLPVPTAHWLGDYNKKIRQGKLPRQLKKLIEKQLAEKRITLIFCPSISLLEALEKRLKEVFPEVRLTAASSKDKRREQKIRRMRRHKYQLFLTTTILERGVTFIGIDVIVLGSNHRVFSQGSLVQIAGRVGRNLLHPTGNVYFLHQGWSRGMVKAISQIREFNRLALKEGVID